MAPEVQPKCFLKEQLIVNNRQLKKRGFLIRFGHTVALLLKRVTKYGHIALWVLEQKAGQVIPLKWI